MARIRHCWGTAAVGTHSVAVRDASQVASTAVKRKALYVVLSLVFASALLVVSLVQVVAGASFGRPGLVPPNWRTSLLAMHSFSFFMLLLGSVYLSEGGESSYWPLVITVLGANVVSFVLRLTVENIFVVSLPTAFYCG
eukprot:m51a1_g14054 hypothetical protein (139) ;mRNA; r:1206941-1207614